MPKDPSPLPEPLTWGPFTVAEARSLAVPEHRLRATDLHTPFTGVRTSAPPSGVRALCEALAVRMSDAQFFSHTTAALLWGFPLPRHLETAPPLHVSAVAPAREPRMKGG